ncbi:MAG: hypothetical protein LQ350_003835 [Teloschistes chrysophthalmus]|nr:MAG: hypothetical protein LQ350_003835 [Niorma chrysophthalma]
MVLCGSLIARFVSFHLFFKTHAAVPSPKAATDLICHTNHASECYPRIFQPTKSFKTVHDDQDLPPGLHVRMNLATGVKEARLNVPESDDRARSSALTVVQDLELPGAGLTPSKKVSVDHPAIDLQQPLGHWKVDVAESTLFTDSVTEVRDLGIEDVDMLLSALSNLEELSHSYHWGHTLAKDGTLIRKLYQLLSSVESSLELRSLAALVLGTAIHNNEAALAVALTHFYNDEWPDGPMEAVTLALLNEQSPMVLSRMMFLLSSLCQDKRQLKRFLRADGVQTLIRVLDAESAGKDAKDKVRTKVTNFVLDRLSPVEKESKSSTETLLGAEWTLAQLRHKMNEQLKA